MIATPEGGWRRFELGEDVLLVPPEGEAAGVVRYRERLRPLLPVAELVARQLADDPQLVVARQEPPLALVTLEGEHAVLVSVTGTLNGQPVQRHLGHVFGDDFYARLGALARVPEQFDRFRAVARQLVEGVALRLGTRRRRVLHDAPPGWRAHTVGLRVDWIPPDFPDDPSCITVWPAVPGGPPNDAPPVPEEPGVAGPWPMRTARGLTGWSWHGDGRFADGTPRRRMFVLLADGQFRYAARLDTTPARFDAGRAALLAVQESVQPIPRASATRTADAIDHWTD